MTRAMRCRGAGRRAAAVVLLAAAALAACSGPVPGQVGSMDPQGGEVGRTFGQAPATVLARTLDLLSRRGEMAAAAAAEWSSRGARELADRGRVELTSESVTPPADTLRAWVVADQRHFVGDAGGRYYLTIRILREAGDSTTVQVISTIVATTPGPGPLGGRPVTSNGTLERTFLDELQASLAPPG